MLLRHVDHLYPQTTLTRKMLEKLGIGQEQVEWMLAAAQTIPNLQLLTRQTMSLRMSM
jgi:hypothetical protein